MIDYQPKRTIKWSALFTLISTLIAYLIASRYFLHTQLPSDFLGISYLSTAFIGHFSFLSTLLWLLVLLPISLIIPNQRLARTLIVLTVALALTLLTIDTFVFQQYRFHLNLFVWNLLINDTNNEIFQFSLMAKMIVTMIAIVVFLFLYLISQAIWKRTHKPFPVIRFYSGFFTIYLTAHFIHVWADAQYIQGITRYNQYLPMYYPATAHSFMEKRGWLNKEAQLANRTLSFNEKNTSIQYPLSPIESDNKEAHFNILMIVIDSWRGDEMNAQTSPNIFEFSKNALRFEDHHSGSNATRTGIFSLMYGLPGVYWDAMLANKKSPVLLDTMKSSGYDFGIFASANLSSPEFDRTAFVGIKDLRLNSTGDTPAERDKNLTEDWLLWIEQQQSTKHPFFGFLFYDAPHGYSVPDNYNKPFLPEKAMNYLLLSPTYDPTEIRNRYKNSVHYNDNLIGRVLNDLKERALLDNTIVLITGDHGQEFNDNGKNYWGHSSNFSRAQTQVPLVIYWPKKAHEVYKNRTTHFEIVPTLMKHAFDVTTPETDYSSGGDLLNHEPRGWSIAGSYRDFAIIESNKITVSGFTGQYEVFDETMNRIEKPSMNVPLVNQAMHEMRRFYTK